MKNKNKMRQGALEFHANDDEFVFVEDWFQRNWWKWTEWIETAAGPKLNRGTITSTDETESNLYKSQNQRDQTTTIDHILSVNLSFLLLF